jgi:hypothetical protein
LGTGAVRVFYNFFFFFFFFFFQNFELLFEHEEMKRDAEKINKMNERTRNPQFDC